jgi:cytochrome c oxidase cbb3-type subunit 1
MIPETATQTETQEERLERAEIDASTRIPVLLFFGAAIFWLIIGTLFALIASFKLHSPEIGGSLGNLSYLTFGRVRTAHLNAVAFGWASCAGIGTSIWLMARLCRAKLVNQSLIIAAAILWNVGLGFGIYGILAGDSTSIEWLEIPTYATPILFVSYALMAIWAIIMFQQRKPGHVYVSQWYLFGAFFWFPWLYGTVQILLLMQPVQGSVQAAINWWFAHNVLGLWFTPIGLAAIYYLIPKVIGQPIYSYYLSILGFWTLAFFYSWNGMHHLIGGPIPAWMVSVSVVASVMMVIPVLTVAINHHMTMRGHFEVLRYSPTLRFTVFGAMAYTLASLQGSSMAFRSLNQVTHFTHYTVGHSHLGLYAFFTMAMFGAMYYIVPRLTLWEWPSASLIRWHFWTTAIGIGFMIMVLSVGGIIQGLALMDNKINFNAVVDLTWVFLLSRSLSGVLILVGHLCFGASFVMMLLKLGRVRTSPTLLGQAGAPAATP